MARLVLTKNCWRLAGLLALPSCMVSFKDYPVGPLGTDTSDGGTHASGSNTGGGVSPGAGTESGGTVTVMGGTSAGNTMSGTGGASGGTAPNGGTGANAGNAGTETGGTSGGMIGMGGEPTDGGAQTEGGAPGVTESPMIDDFEDGDGLILAVSGRSGAWYASNDGTDTQTPKPGQSLVPSTLNPARGASTRGARTSGGSFNIWGALIGTPLKNDSSPYDISGYQGVRFWVKSVSNAWNAAKKMRVALPMTGTVNGSGCTVCNDHFAAEFNLSSTWTQVSVPFSALKQAGTGKPLLGAPDLKHVISLEFGIAAHAVFDVYLDDVELY